MDRRGTVPLGLRAFPPLLYWAAGLYEEHPDRCSACARGRAHRVAARAADVRVPHPLVPDDPSGQDLPQSSVQVTPLPARVADQTVSDLSDDDSNASRPFVTSAAHPMQRRSSWLALDKRCRQHRRKSPRRCPDDVRPPRSRPSSHHRDLRRRVRIAVDMLSPSTPVSDDSRRISELFDWSGFLPGLCVWRHGSFDEGRSGPASA